MADIAKSVSNVRKTRKEYQAEITSLKKQAKTNKKNKKELLLEISRLEGELDNVALESDEPELNENLQSIHKVNSHSLENNESQELSSRVSKAQKRRDKKVKDEKERQLRIAEQDVVNLTGSRASETMSITALLKERGLKIKAINSDGDCLYNSIIHQLEVNKYANVSLRHLRERTATYLTEHRDEFLHFLTNPTSGDCLTEEEYQDYCVKVSSTRAWGGEIELNVLSKILELPIEVIQAEGSAVKHGKDCSKDSLIITYHRHMFGLGEHYNSTEPLENGDNSGDENEWTNSK